MLHPRVAAASLLLMLVLALQPAYAGHCARYTTSTTDPDTQVVVAGAGSYFVVDACDGCFGTWIYDESNGIPGLQRRDAVHDDTCHLQVDPDTVTLGFGSD